MFPFIGFGQEIPEDLKLEFENLACDCIKENESQKIESFSNCLQNDYPRIQKKFEQVYKDLDFENSMKYGEYVMFKSQENLINNCPQYINWIDNQRNQNLQDMKILFESNPNLTLDALNNMIADPNQKEAFPYFFRGLHNLIHDDYEKSILDLKKMIEKEPDNLDAKFYLAMSYEKSGNLIEALNLYKELIHNIEKPEYNTSYFITKKKLEQN